MTTRISIAGKVYDAADITNLSMKDILVFERETAEMFGAPLSWGEVEAWASEIEALPDDKQQLHQRFMLVNAVSLWATRRAAGDILTFSEALDTPMTQIVPVPETADHKPKVAQAGKARARKGTAAPARPAT